MAKINHISARGAGSVRAALAPARRGGHARTAGSRRRSCRCTCRRATRGGRRATTGFAPTRRSSSCARSSPCSTAVRHGDGRQLVAAHRRRERRAADERGAGADARLSSRWRSSARTPMRRWIPASSCCMGPVLAAPRRAAARRVSSLARHGLIEMHEAFAAQVLCNLKGFESREWAERAGFAEPVGEVDRAKLNVMGGSICDRPSVRRHRRRASSRRWRTSSAARRPVRADDGVRGRRNGTRDGAWSAHERRDRSTRLRSRRSRRRIAVVTLDVPDEPVNTLGAGAGRRVRASASTRIDDDTLIQAAGVDLGEARQLHRRRRHRGVPRLPDAADAER